MVDLFDCFTLIQTTELNRTKNPELLMFGSLIFFFLRVREAYHKENRIGIESVTNGYQIH